MTCFYCNGELTQTDYYGKYNSAIGFTLIDGYIFMCLNEDAECHGRHYYTTDGTLDGELVEGYPC